MKRFLILLLLLCTPVFAEVLFVTVKTDGTTYKIVDTEVAPGFAPQVYSGGRYTFTQDAKTSASGYFPIPGEVVLERFNPDGTIDGERRRQTGTFTVALPANVAADSLTLADTNGQPIGTVKVDLEKDGMNLEELAQEGDFFIRYEWLYLLLKWIIILGLVIFGLRFAWKKLRTKK